MLIHRIAAQLYTAEALQAVEAGLDAGEDVTLAVSQSGRTLMAAAQFARRPAQWGAPPFAAPPAPDGLYRERRGCGRSRRA